MSQQEILPRAIQSHPAVVRGGGVGAPGLQREWGSPPSCDRAGLASQAQEGEGPAERPAPGSLPPGGPRREAARRVLGRDRGGEPPSRPVQCAPCPPAPGPPGLLLKVGPAAATEEPETPWNRAVPTHFSDWTTAAWVSLYPGHSLACLCTPTARGGMHVLGQVSSSGAVVPFPEPCLPGAVGWAVRRRSSRPCPAATPLGTACSVGA